MLIGEDGSGTVSAGSSGEGTFIGGLGLTTVFFRPNPLRLPTKLFVTLLYRLWPRASKFCSGEASFSTSSTSDIVLAGRAETVLRLLRL